MADGRGGRCQPGVKNLPYLIPIRARNPVCAEIQKSFTDFAKFMSRDDKWWVTFNPRHSSVQLTGVAVAGWRSLTSIDVCVKFAIRIYKESCWRPPKPKGLVWILRLDHDDF